MKQVVVGIRIWIAVVVVVLAGMSKARGQMPIYGDFFAQVPRRMIKDGGRYYIFYTGFAAPYKWSTDLRNWTWNSSQRVFRSGPPAWVNAAVPTFDQNYWAPDVAYFNGQYHVYYSVSSWGSIDSAIGIAVDHQSGPNELALPVRFAVSHSVLGVTLSWPSHALGFAVGSSTALGANARWSRFTQIPALINDRWWLALPPTNSAQFLRLKR